jgi:hypothetical protein
MSIGFDKYLQIKKVDEIKSFRGFDENTHASKTFHQYNLLHFKQKNSAARLRIG